MEVRILTSYWDNKEWSGITDFLKKINSNELIKYIKETYGEETYKILSTMFLLNTKNVADITYINSDLISEKDNIYFGYFLYYPGYVSYSKIDEKKYFGANFLAPKLPIIDYNRLGTEDISMFVYREGNTETISEIRNSQEKEIFTVIFKVNEIYGSLKGEVLYIEKGLKKVNSIFPGKNISLTNKGKVTNWKDLID